MDPDGDLDKYIDFLSRYAQTEFGRATLDQINASAGFEDKKLDQAWRIAQENEAGANRRSADSNATSRYGTDVSAKTSRANAKLAAETSRYGIDTGRLTDQERIALDAQRLGLDRELGLGGMGIDLVKTAAGLSGPDPSKWFDYLSLLAGGRAMGGLPYFLGSLTGESQLPAFTAPSGSPTPITLDSIINGLGGSGGSGVTSSGLTTADMQTAAFQNRVGDMLTAGAHKFAPGSLERLQETNPTAYGLFQAAGGKKGFAWPDIVAGYRAAQPQLGNPLMA